MSMTGCRWTPETQETFWSFLANQRRFNEKLSDPLHHCEDGRLEAVLLLAHIYNFYNVTRAYFHVIIASHLCICLVSARYLTNTFTAYISVVPLVIRRHT